MAKKKPLHPLPHAVRRWVEEILGFLCKQPLPKRSVRLSPNRRRSRKAARPEIGLIIQYWGEGDDQGELMLLASRETARALLARLFPEALPAADSEEEIDLVKQSLGELLASLASKLLSSYSDGRRWKRVTTPSCIFGRELAIAPDDPAALRVALETPFGRLDILLPGGPP